MKKIPPARKNVSKNVPNGTIIQTRDEYFKGQGDYRKPGYENKGNYRKAVVVDSNRKNEFVLVKFVSSGVTLPSKKYKYKPYVETLDDKNSRIKKGRKFIISKEKITKQDVNVIKKDCYTNKKTSRINIKKTRRIKSRKIKGR